MLMHVMCQLNGRETDNHKGCDVNGGVFARCRVDTTYSLFSPPSPLVGEG